MDTKHLQGILGGAITTGGAVVAWLPTVNLIVQILAGITAIVVGGFTIRYYHRKTKLL
jgi:hypothetical protein